MHTIVHGADSSSQVSGLVKLGRGGARKREPAYYVGK